MTTIKGVVLFHGAGSDRDHSSLKAIEKALKPLKVKRVNFPYRKAGKPFPDRTPVLLDCVHKEVNAAAKKWGVNVSEIGIGGRSMGGRMCSMAVAGAECEPLAAGALILISYPLHPPGKPEKLRVEHLPKIKIPTLFIHGTRDSFATPEELRSNAATIRGRKTFHFIDNGRHELKGADDEIASTIKNWIAKL